MSQPHLASGETIQYAYKIDGRQPLPTWNRGSAVALLMKGQQECPDRNPRIIRRTVTYGEWEDEK